MKPSIRFSDDVVLPMSRDVAWELVTDPRTVVSCVPGAEVIAVDIHGVIQGRLTLSLGPTETQFTGQIEPEFDHANYSGVLAGRGADGKGRTRAQVRTSFRLEDGGSDECRFVVDSEIVVSGALAGFASAGGQAVATRLLTDFSENISRLGDPAVGESAQGPQRLGVLGLLMRTIRDGIKRLFERFRFTKR